MSFFEQDWDPTRRENLPPRVKAWRSSQVNTASSPSHTEKAQKAQASASGSTIVDGKIVKPVNAKPRDNLPSYVHGFHYTNKVGQSLKQTNARSGTTTPSITGRSTNIQAFAGSASRFSGPDFIPNSRKSSTQNASSHVPSSSPARQPSATSIDQRATSEVQETPSATSRLSQGSFLQAHETLQPHLQGSLATKPASVSQSTNENSKAPAKSNAGKASRPIKYSSNFPCTYEECSRGFMNKKALKDHKEEEHDYCRVCDEDYDNEDQLLEHKKNSENHICCGVCGMDFRSEAGRDKHVRQAHPTTQEVECPGCGLLFESGAALVNHAYRNKCKARDRVNELKIRESRAAAALHMAAVSHRASNTSALIAAMQPSETGDDRSVGQSVEGGVPLTLMDQNAPIDGSIDPPSAMSEGSNRIDGSSYTVTAAGSALSKGLADTEWPTLAQSVEKGQNKEEAVIQGLSALKVQASNPGNEVASTPYEKPIPTFGDWPEPSMPDFRRNMVEASGAPHIIRTDWDAFQFTRNGLNGNYDCPFKECRWAFAESPHPWSPATDVLSENYLELNDLKQHLTSGFHQLTDSSCLKCHKHFKTIPGLVAHMERSEKCRVRWTEHFGNVLHVVSGGFLGVSGQHADGSIKIETPEVPDHERHLMSYEDDEEDEPIEVVKPRLLMPAL